MTETDWIACTDPTPMLEFLRGKASDRKLRLFAVACCRRVWDLLADTSSRRVVELAEQAADGLRSLAAIYMARQDAMEVWRAPMNSQRMPLDAQASYDAAYAAASVVEEYPGEKLVDTATRAASSTRRAFRAQAFACEPGKDEISRRERANVAGFAAEDQEAQIQAALARCIFGNPSRCRAIDPHCLTSIVTSLAEAIYNDRVFDRLPILADVLEDAGCTDQNILVHCRGPEPHVRGCWVVDLLLGKK